MELPVIDTFEVQRAMELLRDSAAAKSMGVIVGPNGTGKTEALRAIERSYSKSGLPGRAFYQRCQLNRHSSRGVKDLLDSLGVRQAAFQAGASVQMAIKTCLHHLKRKNIQCLLIDEADLWTADSLIGLVGLFDAAQLQGYPLAILLAATGNPDYWLAPVTSAQSRTLKIIQFGLFDRSLMLEILRNWGPEFAEMAEGCKKNDPGAIKVAARIYKLTGGNFRKLGHYASLHLTYAKGITPNLEIFELIAGKMSN